MYLTKFLEGQQFVRLEPLLLQILAEKVFNLVRALVVVLLVCLLSEEGWLREVFFAYKFSKLVQLPLFNSLKLGN